MCISILSCLNVSVQVKRENLIRGVNLELKQGESCAMIGPNGAGKSTFVKAVLGLQNIREGNVSLLGRDVDRLSQMERARMVAYVPQMLAADISYTVREFVGMGRYALHGSSSDTAVDCAMEMTAVSSFENRIVGTLSGGERQRVCIAAALAQEADLLILDEPLVHLDPGQRETVKSLVEALSRKVSVLAVTHDLEWARDGFDSLLAMKEGRVFYSGDSQSFFKSGQESELFGVSLKKTKGGLA